LSFCERENPLVEKHRKQVFEGEQTTRTTHRPNRTFRDPGPVGKYRNYNKA